MQNQNIDNTDIYLVKRTNCQFSDNDNEDQNKYGDIYIMSKWPKTEVGENRIDDNDEQKGKIEFVLQTSVDGKCLAGELSIEDMQSTAKELNMSYTLLKGECHLALSADEKSDTLSLYTFKLKLKSNENLFTLWKQQSNLQIQYFDVKLREKQDNVDMLDVLVALVQKMPQSTVVPNDDTATILQQANSPQDMRAALKECSEAQQKLERELMSKFCLILNRKKQKINDLQDKLKELTANGNTTASSSSNATEAMEYDDAVFDAETQQLTLPMV